MPCFAGVTICRDLVISKSNIGELDCPTLTWPMVAGTLFRDELPNTPQKNRKMIRVGIFFASDTPKAKPAIRSEVSKVFHRDNTLCLSPVKHIYVPMYTERKPIRCASGPNKSGPTAKPRLDDK
jgi:hypothetical protein